VFQEAYGGVCVELLPVNVWEQLRNCVSVSLCAVWFVIVAFVNTKLKESLSKNTPKGNPLSAHTCLDQTAFFK